MDCDRVKVYSKSEKVYLKNLDKTDKDEYLARIIYDNLDALAVEMYNDGVISTRDILDSEDGAFTLENSISIVHPDKEHSFKKDLELAKKEGISKAKDIIQKMVRLLISEDKYIITLDYLKVLIRHLENEISENERNYA